MGVDWGGKNGEKHLGFPSTRLKNGHKWNHKRNHKRRKGLSEGFTQHITKKEGGFVGGGGERGGVKNLGENRWFSGFEYHESEFLLERKKSDTVVKILEIRVGGPSAEKNTREGYKGREKGGRGEWGCNMDLGGSFIGEGRFIKRGERV